MNVQLLIDSIVRQTTVLVAQIATSGGARAPLAHVANQVFLELTDELAAQGVSRKVSADMFGMALRTYLRRIQRVRESATESGQSLWEAVLDFLSQDRLVTRAQVLRRFQRDDPDIVRGVLHDLSESGLVLRVGSGSRAAYRAATEEELSSLENDDGTEELVWAVIYREGPLSRADLGNRIRSGNLDTILDKLVAAGRVRKNATAADATYSAREFFVPLGVAVGWESAVFDHFQAVVKTICARLAAEPRLDSSPAHAVGGSTYSFEVWPGHPLEAEVLRLLTDVRERTSELRNRVRAHNSAHGRPPQYSDVTFYAGECVVQQDENGGEHET